MKPTRYGHHASPLSGHQTGTACRHRTKNSARPSAGSQAVADKGRLSNIQHKLHTRFPGLFSYKEVEVVQMTSWPLRRVRHLWLICTLGQNNDLRRGC